MTDKFIDNINVHDSNNAVGLFIYKNKIYFHHGRFPMWKSKWIGRPQQIRRNGPTQNELRSRGFVGLYGFEVDRED
jgi:hypothetical protein